MAARIFERFLCVRNAVRSSILAEKGKSNCMKEKLSKNVVKTTYAES